MIKVVLDITMCPNDLYFQRIKSIWDTLPEHKKLEIHGITKVWNEAMEANKPTAILHTAGKDWCEENGFDRTDWYALHTKEIKEEEES